MQILLDIDGVMVSGASFRPTETLSDGFSKFTDKSVSALNRIIDETGASIVLTTSHKFSYSIGKWKAIFKARGININTISRLPKNTSHLNRKEEISIWLRNKNLNSGFVIIDDDKSLNGLSKNLKANLFLTKSMVGLNETYVDSIVKTLKNSEFELVH